MGDLAEGVDAVIGASGPLHQHRRAAEAVDRLLEGRLHRRAIGLALPADEAGPVVLHDDPVTRHGSTVPTGSAKPRRKAAVAIGSRPARCTVTSRRAPRPQAMVPASSSTVPGLPSAAIGVAASTRSEEHTSELQSLMRHSYAVF